MSQKEARTFKKWRKRSPATHRSYAEKRGRIIKQIVKEVKEAICK